MNKKILFIASILIVSFSGCTKKSKYYYSGAYSKPKIYLDSKTSYNTRLDSKAYRHPTMNAYTIHGIRYYPHDTSVGAIYSGNASWYGPNFHGKLTSNGEGYNMHAMTAAHKTLPMNTVVKVSNHDNGRTVVVRINDRGPFISTRIIDLSKAAANKINMIGAGTAKVSIEVLGFYSKNKKIKIKRQEQIKKVKFVEKKKIIKSSKYSLQIASFTNIEGALKIQEQYNGIDGYTTKIKDIQTNQGRLFKVYLKGFKNEEEIRAYKSNSDFEHAFIVKED